MFDAETILKIADKYGINIAYGGFYDRRLYAACPVALLSMDKSPESSGKNLEFEDLAKILNTNIYYLSGIMQGFDHRFSRPPKSEPNRTDYVTGWEDGKNLRTNLDAVYKLVNINRNFDYKVDELKRLK